MQMSKKTRVALLISDILKFIPNKITKEHLAPLVAQMVKKSACNVRNLGLIPRLGRSPREGSGHPLQYSCLENSMDKEAWQTTIYRVTKSQI